MKAQRDVFLRESDMSWAIAPDPCLSLSREGCNERNAGVTSDPCLGSFVLDGLVAVPMRRELDRERNEITRSSRRFAFALFRQAVCVSPGP